MTEEPKENAAPAKSNQPEAQAVELQPKNFEAHLQATRAALGRTARIGDLYDIRNDHLLFVNIFNSDPTGLIVETPNPETDSDFCSSDKFSTKARHFNIQSELSLSILADIVPLKGAASFLHDKKQSQREMQCSLIQKVRTVDQSLNVYDGRLTNLVDKRIWKDFERKATHVVVGIEWGANVSVVFSGRIEDDTTKFDWAGKLETRLTGLGLPIGAKSEAKQEANADTTTKESSAATGAARLESKWTKDSQNKAEDVKVTVHADLKLPKTVTSIEDAKNFLANVTEQIGQEKMGRQQQFRLLPLSVVKQATVVEKPGSLEGPSVSDEMSLKIHQLMDIVDENFEKLHDKAAEVETNKDLLPLAVSMKIRDFTNKMDIERAKLIREYKEALCSTRSSKEEDTKKREELLAKFIEKLSASDLMKGLDKFITSTKLDDRLELLRRFDEFGVRIGERSLREVRGATDKASAFVLFYSFGYEHHNVACDMFFKLVRTYGKKEEPEPDEETSKWCGLKKPNKQKEYLFVAVDLDVFPNAQKKEGIAQEGLRIFKIEHLRYVPCEIFELEMRRFDEPTVRLKQGKAFRRGRPAPRLSPLEIRCPSYLTGRNCSQDRLKWICYECADVVNYGFNGRLYCSCGSQKASHFLYRCGHPSHPRDLHVPYPWLSLRRELSHVRQEIVIAVIGEKNSGKSSWVDSIANYVKFENYDEAAVANLPRVTKMEDEPEKSARAYEFSLWTKRGPQPTKIRIIDTPGLSYSETEDDDDARRQIVRHLTDQPELNLICFVIHSSSCGKAFETSFKKLIMMLPRSAVDHIVFVFADAPGKEEIKDYGAFADLQRFINEFYQKQGIILSTKDDRIFCVNNTFYPHFKDMPDPDDVRKAYTQSREETLQLFKKARRTQPYKTDDILALNLAHAFTHSDIDLRKPLVETVEASVTTELPSASNPTPASPIPTKAIAMALADLATDVTPVPADDEPTDGDNEKSPLLEKEGQKDLAKRSRARMMKMPAQKEIDEAIGELEQYLEAQIHHQNELQVEPGPSNSVKYPEPFQDRQPDRVQALYEQLAWFYHRNAILKHNDAPVIIQQTWWHNVQTEKPAPKWTGEKSIFNDLLAKALQKRDEYYQLDSNVASREVLDAVSQLQGMRGLGAFAKAIVDSVKGEPGKLPTLPDAYPPTKPFHEVLRRVVNCDWYS